MSEHQTPTTWAVNLICFRNQHFMAVGELRVMDGWMEVVGKGCMQYSSNVRR